MRPLPALATVNRYHTLIGGHGNTKLPQFSGKLNIKTNLFGLLNSKEVKVNFWKEIQTKSEKVLKACK